MQGFCPKTGIPRIFAIISAIKIRFLEVAHLFCGMGGSLWSTVLLVEHVLKHARHEVSLGEQGFLGWTQLQLHRFRVTTGHNMT